MTLESGGLELLDQLKDMMNALTDYHKGVSTFFSNDFKESQFYDRKMSLKDKEVIKIFIAYIDKKKAGYLIVSKDKGVGTIESLYVDESFRGNAVGDQLMENGLEWLSQEDLDHIKVSVAYGNDVLPFYKKFGFYPRSIILKDAKEVSGL